jgi:hypothetical protein
MTTSGLVTALTTAMRMVNRVHNRTTNGRANAHPTLTASFTDFDVGVLSIAYFANGGATGNKNATHF